MALKDAERVQVKLYADGESPEAAALIPVFHQWIRDGRIEDELLIDVADYSHVHEGPGVMLIGHGADWYYDLGEGRPGIMFSRKRAFEGDFAARLADAIERATDAARKLEAEDIGLHFDDAELLVRVPDRLHAPNDETTYRALEEAVTKAASGAGKHADVQRIDDGLLSARVQLS